MQNDWRHIEYILYFKDEPEELIACNYYGVRLVYNPKLSSEVLDGLDVTLSDDEQVRVRNRVLNSIYGYACYEGKIKLQNYMYEPAVFSEKYYDNQKNGIIFFD